METKGVILCQHCKDKIAKYLFQITHKKTKKLEKVVLCDECMYAHVNMYSECQINIRPLNQ